MARSKRNKIGSRFSFGFLLCFACFQFHLSFFPICSHPVSLTKTSSKGRELKVKLVDTIRSTLDEYKSVFLPLWRVVIAVVV